jgi:2-polyprenyl-6-methoxyphenol hydroxylase-like FAD-dependent oxidoreductase
MWRSLLFVPLRKSDNSLNGLQLPEQIRQSFLAAVEKGNIRSMPNKTMPALPRPTPGALLMGDAFNMRHPLTGGGMTVALSDIVLLRDMLRPLRNFQDAESLSDYMQAFYTRRKVCVQFFVCLDEYSSLIIIIMNLHFLVIISHFEHD